MKQQTETYKIKDLIWESTNSSSSQSIGPTLQAFTRSTRDLIYEDIIAVQETENPVASLYGARYLNSAGDASFLSNATYSGAINKRTDIPNLAAGAYTKNKMFKVGDQVFKVLVPVTLSADINSVYKALIKKQIRYMSAAAETADLEDSDVADVGVRIDRWDASVKTRKLKTSFSLELLRDMESNQLVGKNVPFDLLTTIIAEDTNKDIIQKLLHVSKIHSAKGITDGVFDSSTIAEKDLGRLVYACIVSMGDQVRRDSSFAPTFVLASTNVISKLKSSGWIQKSKSDKPMSEGTTRCGLHVYADDTSDMDYAVVGFKHRLGELEYVSSLFYSPYTSTYLIAKDVQSFNDNIMIMNRYALSVNPYALEKSDKAEIIQADDWDNLGGKSVNSRCVMFDFK